VYKYILLGFLLLSFGCISYISGNQNDAIINPENYLGKNVTIEIPVVTIYNNPPLVIENITIKRGEGFDPNSFFKYYSSVVTQDKEGKPTTHILYLNYSQFYCDKCRISGEIKKIDLCRCTKSYSYRIIAKTSSGEIYEIQRSFTYYLYNGGSFISYYGQEVKEIPSDECMITADDQKLAQNETWNGWQRIEITSPLVATCDNYTDYYINVNDVTKIS